MFVLCAVTVLASISPATANNYTHAPTPLVPEVQVETESNAPEAEAEAEPKQELEALPEIEVKSAQSDWPVSVWLNGEEMALTIPTILNNGITYVSIGDFCRVMGCDISFEGGVFTAIRGQELEISCTSGNFYLLANEILYGRDDLPAGVKRLTESHGSEILDRLVEGDKSHGFKRLTVIGRVDREGVA